MKTDPNASAHLKKQNLLDEGDPQEKLIGQKEQVQGKTHMQRKDTQPSAAVGRIYVTLVRSLYSAEGLRAKQ